MCCFGKMKMPKSEVSRTVLDLLFLLKASQASLCPAVTPGGVIGFQQPLAYINRDEISLCFCSNLAEKSEVDLDGKQSIFVLGSGISWVCLLLPWCGCVCALEVRM